MFRFYRAIVGLALATATATALAKGSSAPPAAPTGAPRVMTPCWFAVPGKMQMVNLNHLSEVRVVDESKERYRVLLNSSNGAYSRLAEVVGTQQEAAQLLDSIRSASLECR